jgi:hypothetical protein
MTSGARVVLALFAAVLAIALIAVGGYLLTRETPVECVEGELQDNAFRADGSVLPRVESFPTVEQAESFICRRIPHPRDTDGLAIKEVRVARKLNLGRTIEGEGGADIEIDYAAERDTQLAFTFGAFFPPLPLPRNGDDGIALQGVDAIVNRAGDAGTIQWNKGQWTFTGGTDGEGGFTLDDLLRVLESVR